MFVPSICLGISRYLRYRFELIACPGLETMGNETMPLELSPELTRLYEHANKGWFDSELPTCRVYNSPWSKSPWLGASFVEDGLMFVIQPPRSRYSKKIDREQFQSPIFLHEIIHFVVFTAEPLNQTDPHGATFQTAVDLFQRSTSLKIPVAKVDDHTSLPLTNDETVRAIGRLVKMKTEDSVILHFANGGNPDGVMDLVLGKPLQEIINLYRDDPRKAEKWRSSIVRPKKQLQPTRNWLLKQLREGQSRKPDLFRV